MDAAEFGGHANFSLAGTRDGELKQFTGFTMSCEPVCAILDMESKKVQVHSRLKSWKRN